MTALVVGVSGSRREGSHTRKAVVHALRAAEDAGVETELIDLGDVDLPLYHPDLGDRGDASRLRKLVRRADGAVLGTPTYHNSYSSAIKSFLDYCGKEEFADTPVGLIAVSGGSVSIAGALNHLRIAVRGVRGNALPEQVAVTNASDRFDGDAFVDDETADRVARVGRTVARHARRRVPAGD